MSTQASECIREGGRARVLGVGPERSIPPPSGHLGRCFWIEAPSTAEARLVHVLDPGVGEQRRELVGPELGMLARAWMGAHVDQPLEVVAVEQPSEFVEAA